MNNQTRELFTIYILGILDNGIANQNSNNSFLLINNWNTFLRNNIINMIPMRYNIKFIHCDIIETQNQRERLLGNQNKIIHLKSMIDNLICDNDRRSSNRVIESNFTTRTLDFENIRTRKNYLIIDMAGVFTTRRNLKETLLRKYVSKPYLRRPNRTFVKYKFLNVVNLPYINNDLSGNYELAPSDIAKTRFFTILDNGSVITYEQRLIQIDYTSNTDYKLNNIYRNICDQILRNKNISVVEASNEKNILKHNKLIIMRMIMNNLMNSNIKTFEELKIKSMNDIESIFIPY